MSTKLIASILIFVSGLLIATSAQAQVAISEDGVTFPGDLEPVWAVKQYEIGDRGPAGGWVFYVTDDGLHGLEAAPADNSDTSTWGCTGMEIPGAYFTAVGAGARNTDDIIRSCNVSPPAAATAALIFNSQSNSGTKGYLDWYLPSIDELVLMYEKLHVLGLGGFDDTGYWSSTEFDFHTAYAHDFVVGLPGIVPKIFPYRVRAVRAF